MSTAYKDLIQQTFADIQSLDAEKLLFLADETMKYFRDLQEKIASPEPSVREEVMKESLELKEILETQMLAFCKTMGLNPAQLANMAENSAGVSPQEKALIDQIKDKFKALQLKRESKVSKRKKRLKILT